MSRNNPEVYSGKNRLIPRRYKLGVIALFALTTKAGINDDLAHVSYESAKVAAHLVAEITGHQDKAPTPTSKSAKATVVAMPIAKNAPAEKPSTNCLGNTYDGFYFSPNAPAIIDTINYTKTKRDFLLRALISVCEVKRAGGLDNPIVSLTQASLESANGTDTLSPYNNYFGHKAKEGLPSVTVPTKEFNGKKLATVKRDFAVYDDPEQSFYDHSEMIGRLKWFKDAVACRWDTMAYVEALQNDVDEGSCTVVRHLGERDVMAYATDPKYPQKLADRMDYIHATELIVNQNA